MTLVLYNRITNATIVIAVISALSFERAGQFAWLVGTVGIASGVVAATAYFWNQFSKSSVDIKVSDGHGDILSQGLNEPVVSEGEAESSAMQTLYIRISKSHHYQLFPYEIEREDKFADDVAAIVNKLCSAEGHPSFEFILTRDGNFLIREVRHSVTSNAEIDRNLEAKFESVPAVFEPIN